MRSSIFLLCKGCFSEIGLAVNLDGVGYRKGKTAVSLYDCPEYVGRIVRSVVGRKTGILEGEPWFQGDHSIFLQNGIPACAFTSDALTEILTRIAHTARDTVELIDPDKLVEAALTIREIVDELSTHPSYTG